MCRICKCLFAYSACRLAVFFDLFCILSASMLNHEDLLAGEFVKLEAEGAVFEREGDIFVFGDGFYCAYARELDLKVGIVNGQDILDDLDARAALDGVA